ncbi:MAG: preprotein translocase subunit SecE [Faecalimonas sp.]|nr:preprotein translocase subunit SecE [Faecalimonas sp.]
MAENTEKVVKSEKTAKTEKVKKPSWFKGLKAEFKKIVWPDRKTLAKQTVAVIVCSILLGAIIAVIDVLIQYGIDFLVK